VSVFQCPSCRCFHQTTQVVVPPTAHSVIPPVLHHEWATPSTSISIMLPTGKQDIRRATGLTGNIMSILFKPHPLLLRQSLSCSAKFLHCVLSRVLTLSAHDSTQATTVTMSEYDVDGLGRAFERGGIDVIKGKWHVMERPQTYTSIVHSKVGRNCPYNIKITYPIPERPYYEYYVSSVRSSLTLLKRLFNSSSISFIFFSIRSRKFIRTPISIAFCITYS